MQIYIELLHKRLITGTSNVSVQVRLTESESNRLEHCLQMFVSPRPPNIMTQIVLANKALLIFKLGTLYKFTE